MCDTSWSGLDGAAIGGRTHSQVLTEIPLTQSSSCARTSTTSAYFSSPFMRTGKVNVQVQRPLEHQTPETVHI